MQPVRKLRRPVPRDRIRPWRVCAETRVYDAAPWFRVVKQRVRLPDGRHLDDYHQIYMPDFVTIVPITAEGKFVLVRKYNHGFRRIAKLFPGGMRDPHESIRHAAERELKEETGFVSHSWKRLGSFIPHSNYGCGHVHIYLAQACQSCSQPQSGDLEAMDLCLMPELELVRYLRKGHNPSLACHCAYLLARDYVRGC